MDLKIQRLFLLASGSLSLVSQWFNSSNTNRDFQSSYMFSLENYEWAWDYMENPIIPVPPYCRLIKESWWREWQWQNYWYKMCDRVMHPEHVFCVGSHAWNPKTWETWMINKKNTLNNENLVKKNVWCHAVCGDPKSIHGLCLV